MRELTLDEVSHVAGGGQQTSEEGPWVWGDPSSGGSGGGGGRVTPPAVTDSAPPPSIVLQQFFDDLAYHVKSSNDYTGSSYDHDEGSDMAAPPSNWLGLPSHDPSQGAAYWHNWDGGTDQEFVDHLMESLPTKIIDGLLALPGLPANNAVAIAHLDDGNTGAYVNGIYYEGTFHANSPLPPAGTDNEGAIVVYGGNDGYWTFTPTHSSSTPLFSLPVGDLPAGSGLSSLAPENPVPIPVPAGWNSVVDSNIDTAGGELAKAIQSMPNYTTTEYSAYIWIDGAGVHTSKIVAGNNYNTGPDSFNPQAYGVPLGAQIVGFVHSHPAMFLVPPGLSEKFGAPEGSYIPNSNAKYTDIGDMNGMNWMATSNPNNPAYVENGINYFRNYVIHGSGLSEYDFAQYPNKIGGPDGTALTDLPASAYRPVAPQPSA